MCANPISHRDFANLAELLYTKEGFSRPDGQKVGYSLEEGGSIETSNSVCAPTTAQTNPGDISLPPTVVDHHLGLPLPSESIEAKQKNNRKQIEAKPKGYAIWTEEELSTALHSSNRRLKPREGVEEPEYDVLYQEKVTAEDVFFGMEFTKENNSGLIVKVIMPKLEKITELTLEVDPYELRVSSSKYFLRAALPKKVVSGKADGKWDSTCKSLNVYLEVDEK